MNESTKGAGRRGSRTRGWGGALAAVLAAACVSGRDIANRAVDYNVAAGEARDEMLLLNVLRSRDRRAMVFTGLSRITGSLRQTAEIAGEAPFGGDAPNEGEIGTAFGLTDAPSFDVAILDSQEFTRGIMTPVSLNLLEYYWDQGYTREVLLYLCVERVELDRGESAGGPIELVNEPGEPRFDEFQSLLYRVADTGRFEPNPHQMEDIGPVVAEAEAADLSTLIRLGDSGLSLERDGEDGWQLRRPTDLPRLVVPGAALHGGLNASSKDLHLYSSKAAFERARERSPDEPKGRLVLRSPQAVLYFLGELTRPDKTLAIRPRREGQPEHERMLFVVRPADECSGRAIVGVTYDGTRYVIPDGEGACHPGRTMQSLAFAGQLLSLQQSASDLPVTGSVRIIGN